MFYSKKNNYLHFYKGITACNNISNSLSSILVFKSFKLSSSLIPIGFISHSSSLCFFDFYHTFIISYLYFLVDFMWSFSLGEDSFILLSFFIDSFFIKLFPGSISLFFPSYLMNQTFFR